MKCNGDWFSWNGAFNIDGNRILAFDSRIARSLWIDDLTIERPNFVPFHYNDGLGRALCGDEKLQAFNSETSSKNTANGWHTWIIPAGDNTLFNKVCQLT